MERFFSPPEEKSFYAVFAKQKVEDEFFASRRSKKSNLFSNDNSKQKKYVYRKISQKIQTKNKKYKTKIVFSEKNSLNHPRFVLFCR